MARAAAVVEPGLATTLLTQRPVTEKDNFMNPFASSPPATNGAFNAFRARPSPEPAVPANPAPPALLAADARGDGLISAPSILPVVHTFPNLVAAPASPPVQLSPIDQMLISLDHSSQEAYTNLFLEHWQVLPALRSSNGRPLLVELVRRNCFGRIDSLLRSHNAIDHLRALDAEGNSALMHACQLGDLSVVRTLLAYHPAIQLPQVGPYGNALIAALHANVNVVKFMLQLNYVPMKAQLQATCSAGDNALMHAVRMETMSLVLAILQPVTRLANSEGRELVDYLVHYRNLAGESAMSLAQKCDDQGIATVLAHWIASYRLQ